jgi:hypothetical protein
MHYSQSAIDVSVSFEFNTLFNRKPLPRTGWLASLDWPVIVSMTAIPHPSLKPQKVAIVRA